MKLALCLLVGAITSTIANAGYASNCLLKCSDKNEPVCGSNGVTYTNECLLNLANCESSEPITKVHEGGCINATTPLSPYEPPSCPDMCPAIYDPVCASNGLTYPSGCALGIASCQSGGAITYVSDGPCSDTESSPSSCSDKCIEVYRPVCGTDNVTYGNSCFLEFASCKNASISLAYEGACNANGNKDCETSDTSTASDHLFKFVLSRYCQL
ncbi:Protease inhibitor protein [Plasmopara halstedii]|uniref:Protease inhibitor protein n=1 Tax=Plasmopara halstedii TaxID=4781 RepID=A0A0P1A6Z1_PLAHL|nr:Protease inhibitor protein [Plasmopara halstedii]CEG36082.1 Protease inhibitor protein [Plasmopara halstedii]|eukprot:XP_024572451.1 Protease inhibitor protein [Plasmopara halstedii]